LRNLRQAARRQKEAASVFPSVKCKGQIDALKEMTVLRAEWLRIFSAAGRARILRSTLNQRLSTAFDVDVSAVDLALSLHRTLK
jgi:hypothetical protein